MVVPQEEALVAALESGAVGGAGIDCFEHILLHGDDGPPTQEQHLGLPSMENVALTPHVAACERSNTPSVFFMLPKSHARRRFERRDASSR